MIMLPFGRVWMIQMTYDDGLPQIHAKYTTDQSLRKWYVFLSRC